MGVPLVWRLFRATGWACLFGFLVLAGLSVAYQLGQDEELAGKPEYVAWTFAALAYPFFALVPLPALGQALWGFVRAASASAVGWYAYDRATVVSDNLHHSDPVWFDVAIWSLIFAGLVPWSSWKALFAATRPGVPPPDPAAPG